MKLLFSILTLTTFLFTFSQENYELDTIDKPKREAFVKEFQSRQKALIEEVESKYSGKIYKGLKKNLEEFQKDFIEELNDRTFFFDERFQNKANEILYELQTKNNSIALNTKILLSKDPTLNAHCLPNGIFVANIGLFYWLNNEDQIAGIIAHEMAHKILNHSINTQVENIEQENSKNSKETLSTLKNQKYKKGERAFELMKNLLYAKGKKRKKQELEADSLGYLLLQNTKYNKLDYIESLRLTEKYDSIKPEGVRKETYKKIFDIPAQPFNEKWLNLEDFSQYNYNAYEEKLNIDSLSTHPETSERIKKLEQLFPELKVSKSLSPTEDFVKLEKITQHNLIPNFVFFENYGVSIYLCLLRLQENTSSLSNEYYKKWLGEIFNKIFVARKEYKLNRYLDRINPKEDTESYIQFLSFMWNLKTEEIKNIADFYSNPENYSK